MTLRGKPAHAIMAAATRGLVHKNENLLGRFRGAMVGAVVGDCLGAHFEMTWNVAVNEVVDFFSGLVSLSPQVRDADSDSEEEHPKHKLSHMFTDDTAMARSIAASLIQHNQVDARDMAERFATEYGREPWRGYGGSVARVFHQLEEEGFRCPHGPASRQFDGAGSYGNGGAMRIVPAALFTYNLGDQAANSVTDAITRVTHSHRDGVNGAKLQCAAVRAALREAAGSSPDTDRLLQQLAAVTLSLETASCSGAAEEGVKEQQSPSPKRKRKSEDGGTTPYSDKLQLIGEYLKSDTEISRSDIEEFLGNDVSALGSVPTALYCFLRAARPIPDIPVDDAFERTIIFAVTIGGDTDTIATMAGAMAGAYYGIDAIPAHWRKECEGVEEADAAAVKLHQLGVLDRKAGDLCIATEKSDSTEKNDAKYGQKENATAYTDPSEQSEQARQGGDSSSEEAKRD